MTVNRENAPDAAAARKTPTVAASPQAPDDAASPQAAGSTASAQAAVGAEEPAHPTNRLDEMVHQRHRLGILTIADEAERVEFTYLRETLGLTGGNLSRHLAVLEEAKLIEVAKGYEGRRPRTWVSISAQGRASLDAELDALRQLVARRSQRAARPKPK